VFVALAGSFARTAAGAVALRLIRTLGAGTGLRLLARALSVISGLSLRLTGALYTCTGLSLLTGALCAETRTVVLRLSRTLRTAARAGLRLVRTLGIKTRTAVGLLAGPRIAGSPRALRRRRRRMPRIVWSRSVHAGTAVAAVNQDAGAAGAAVFRMSRRNMMAGRQRQRCQRH
jgi:hypothetical protein